MKKDGYISVLIDLQAGSCGKGKIAGYIARRDDYAASISNAMPNSGHIYVDEKIGKREFRNIPISIVNPNTELFMGAGCALDMEVLIDEYNRNKDLLKGRKIYTHPRVPLIEERHKEFERQVLRSGSTFKGGGAALAEKAMRDPRLKYFEGYEDIVALSELDYYKKMRQIIESGGNITIEGSQGIDLCLNHSPNYPFVTSRTVSAAQMVSDSGLPPLLLKKVIGIMRPYPIRISNKTNIGIDIYSGDYGSSKELNWEEIENRSLANLVGIDLEEITTVTKKTRRVFEIDQILLEKNAWQNSLTEVAINFIQHLDIEYLGLKDETGNMYLDTNLRRYIEYIEEITGTQVSMLGTGPDNSEIIKRKVLKK